MLWRRARQASAEEVAFCREQMRERDQALARIAVAVSIAFNTFGLVGAAIYARGIGLYLLVSRAADVVLDPMIGKWSDTTRSKFGRRKIWMVIGTPILMLGAFVVFTPMIPVNGVYLLVASFIIYLGGSTVGLPYSAWGTEIAETYHGRSRMAGFRETAGVVGGLLAGIIPAITGLFGHGVDRFTMTIMGAAIIVLTPLTVWLSTRYVEEPPVRRRVFVPLWSSLVALYKNIPFRIFCLSYVIFTIGSSVASVTMVFFMTDYLRAATMFGPAYLALTVTTVASVPAWLWTSRRIGKHKATALSLLFSMVLYAGVTPFIPPGHGWLYVGLLAILGVSSCGFTTLPLGMIGDIIDYDTLMHGEPRGGILWGIWSFAQKVSPVFGIFVTLQILSWLGFKPGTHNTHEALNALKYVYCFGPVPFYVAGGLLLFWFPINARRHNLIRRRLDQREARRPKG